MFLALTGALAGLVHVYSGPDHLAAVAPLAAHGRDRAWLAGFRWGLGHSTGVIVIGLFSLLLREWFPLNLIASSAERLVSLVLIAIGLWGLRKAFTNHVHTHEHAHDGRRHVHIHVHSHGHKHGERAFHAHTHAHTAFAVGALHGLAGSSHFIGVLPALAFTTQAEAVLYLLSYGGGTILAMITFSSAVALAARSMASGKHSYRAVMCACSAVALAIGCWRLLV
jgi:hypothetical protein